MTPLDHEGVAGRGGLSRARSQLGVEIRPCSWRRSSGCPSARSSRSGLPRHRLSRAARHTPSGPSSTTVPPVTSRTVQPSIVVGRVSGTGRGLGDIRARSRETLAVVAGEAAACCAAEVSRIGGGAAVEAQRASSCPRPAAPMAAGTAAFWSSGRLRGFSIRFSSGAAAVLAGAERAVRDARPLERHGGRSGSKRVIRAPSARPSQGKSDDEPGCDDGGAERPITADGARATNSSLSATSTSSHPGAGLGAGTPIRSSSRNLGCAEVIGPLLLGAYRWHAWNGFHPSSAACTALNAPFFDGGDGHRSSWTRVAADPVRGDHGK